MTRPESPSMCPYLSGIDWKGKLVKIPCQGLACEFYQHIYGQHPQTDETIDQWGCAILWHNTLLIETAQQARQTGAAVESFRNETVRQNEQTRNLFRALAAQPQLPEGNGNLYPVRQDES